MPTLTVFSGSSDAKNCKALHFGLFKATLHVSFMKVNRIVIISIQKKNIQDAGQAERNVDSCTVLAFLFKIPIYIYLCLIYVYA